jgi:hypothetical protein
VAKFDKVIPPGQEGIIKLEIEGAKVHGKFAKTASVHSNDPGTPVMTISLEGEEQQYIDVLPTEKVYLQGRYGETVEKSVVLKSNEPGADFKLTGIESNIDDKITYKVDPGPDAGEYTLNIFKNPKLPNLNTYGSLTVHTNSEKSPEKVIQVQVVTKGSITVQPTTLNFGAIAFGKPGTEASPITREITVIKSEGEFAIRDVQFNSNRYSGHPPQKTVPRQREIGEMIIYTSDPREPTLTVKLVARSL